MISTCGKKATGGHDLSVDCSPGDKQASGGERHLQEKHDSKVDNIGRRRFATVARVT
jgi:hypothetical protein